MKNSKAVSKLVHLRDHILVSLPTPKAAANYSFLSNSKANRQLRQIIEWLDQQILDLNRKSKNNQLSEQDATQIIDGLNYFDSYYLKIDETLMYKIIKIKVKFVVYRDDTLPFREKLPYKI